MSWVFVVPFNNEFSSQIQTSFELEYFIYSSDFISFLITVGGKYQWHNFIVCCIPFRYDLWCNINVLSA
jgi:hypothetical protein